MDNSLMYDNGKENYQQVIFCRMNEMDDIANELLDVLKLEFPKGTKIKFAFGRGVSNGKVHYWHVNGYDVMLNVILHTGKHHYIDIRKVRQILSHN